MAAMSIAEGLISDIDTRVDHIRAQVGMGVSKEVLANEQCEALLNRFSELGELPISDITRVSYHLQSSNIWTRSHLEAFSACLRASASNRLNQPGIRKGQTNLYLEWYLTQQDWDSLDAAAMHTEDLIEIVGVRMHHFGITCPDHETLKRASAIVQVIHNNKRVTREDKREFAWGVKRVIKKLDVDSPWPFCHIRAYPRSPFELDADILNHACGTAERPVSPPDTMIGNHFRRIVKNTPYKKSGLSQTPSPDPSPAKHETLPIVQVHPPGAEASSGLGAAPFAHMMNAFMQSAMQQLLQHMSPPAAIGGGADSLNFGPFEPSRSLPSIGSDACTEPDVSIAATEPNGNSDDDSLSFKAGMAVAGKAIGNGHLKRKAANSSASDPAGTIPTKCKTAAKAKSQPAKKPAAPTPVRKRPAGAEVNLDIEAWVREHFSRTDAESLPRKNFTNRLHHSSYNAALSAGMGDKAASELRSLIRKRAGVFWDKHRKHG